MQFVVEKIRADKKLFTAENMRLTEAEAKVFWPVYEQYQDELFLLRARTMKLINDYAKTYEKMNNDTAKNLLDEVITIETLGLKLRQSYLPKFRKVLPDVKVVRYYRIENKINAALMCEVAANIPLIEGAEQSYKKEVKMMRTLQLTTILLVLAFATVTFMSANSAAGSTAAEIDGDVKSALGKLYGQSPSAKAIGEKAKGILVFPSIAKGGFLVGGQYGESALLKGRKTSGYYNTIQVSYGLQAGIQKYGYALFFMTESAMKWLDKSDGWEIGVGPSIVVVDVGAATSHTTTTLQADICAFFFDQKGLMGGLGLQGTKISKVKK